ncbi:unnamed protein product, partial [Meganyctiphanes norvegica]
MESPDSQGNIESKDIPQVVVVLGDGTISDAWTVQPPQVKVTRYGDSSGSCTPNSNRSGSLASLLSDASVSDHDQFYDVPSTNNKDTSMYLDSGFENDNRPSRRIRHNSDNPSTEGKPQLSPLHNDLRLCASHENILIGDEKKNKKNTLKTMFLDVFHIDSHGKRRSKSTSNETKRHRSPSTGPVQKMISRIRSSSHGDINNIRDRSTSVDSVCSNNSLDNHVEGTVCLDPGTLYDDVSIEFPPAAINTHLVGRFRKKEQGKNRRRSINSNESSNGVSGQKSESIPKLKLDHTGGSSTDYKENSPPIISHHERKKRLGRTRSNSESNIYIE